MSRRVHLLKIIDDNIPFIVKVIEDKECYVWLIRRRKYVEAYSKYVNDFNSEKNISVGPEFHKGLSLPRFKLMMALIIQKLKVDIDYVNLFVGRFGGHFGYTVENTPARFKEKIHQLMYWPGFYLLGTVIEDSLSGDAEVNCGNPFEFLPGDLGFWWAGVVIMDFLKYKRDAKVENKCLEFYNDPCLPRKHKYYQNSAMSSLDRIPQQFLSELDENNFMSTIGKYDKWLMEINFEDVKKHLEKMNLMVGQNSGIELLEDI